MSLTNFDKNMAAVTFAEAGEADTARELIHETDINPKGASQMGSNATTMQKKKPYLPALGFGMVSLTLYAILLLNEGQVMDAFTRGGWYTVLPVGGAFLFSFIHGAFASNLLSVLGLEAKK